MKEKKVIKIFACIYLFMFGFNTIVLAKNMNCQDPEMAKLRTDLQNLFNLLKIFVPLLIIGLSVIDFIKALAAKDEKDVKKAFTKFGKRCLYALILFFLPLLLNYLLKIAGTNADVCVE